MASARHLCSLSASQRPPPTRAAAPTGPCDRAVPVRWPAHARRRALSAPRARPARRAGARRPMAGWAESRLPGAFQAAVAPRPREPPVRGVHASPQQAPSPSQAISPPQTERGRLSASPCARPAQARRRRRCRRRHRRPQQQPRPRRRRRPRAPPRSSAPRAAPHARRTPGGRRRAAWCLQQGLGLRQGRAVVRPWARPAARRRPHLPARKQHGGRRLRQRARARRRAVPSSPGRPARSETWTAAHSGVSS